MTQPFAPRPVAAWRRVHRTAALPPHLAAETVGEALFAHWYGAAPEAFWLDSARLTAGARFSYLGDAAGPHSLVLRHRIQDGPVLPRVQHLLAARACPPDPALPFGFQGGLVGWIGYELMAETLGVNGPVSDADDLRMIFADRLIVLDHAAGTVTALALYPADDGPAADAAAEAAARDWCADRIAALAALAPPQPSPPQPPLLPLLPPPPDTATAGPLRRAFHPRHDDAAYLARIGACLEALRQGESYELCLTNRLTAEADGFGDPWAAYRVLRRRNPAPYAAFLTFPDLAVLGCSPERLVRLDHAGRLEAKPIKGTAPRAEDPDADAALATALQQDEKTRAENLMIVDLLRHDLGSVAEWGSVAVPGLMQIESYATVHQLVSTVTAQLRAGCDAVDVVRAVFPPGSMTGAPKKRSCEILTRLEDGPRGLYSGAIGYLSTSGAMDLSVVIRTAILHKAAGGRPPRLDLGTGGAIVTLSDPMAELAETRLKAARMVEVLAALPPDA